jgi:hypothetical protein
MAEPKNQLGDWVVTGFIISVVCGLAAGIPGMQWIGWGAVLGILPFCAVVVVAILGQIAGLFRR